MNTLQKRMLLFAIVPAVALSLAAASATSADAARVVCGDKLCSEVGPDYLQKTMDAMISPAAPAMGAAMSAPEGSMDDGHMEAGDRMEGDDRMEGHDRMHGDKMMKDRDYMDGDKMMKDHGHMHDGDKMMKDHDRMHGDKMMMDGDKMMMDGDKMMKDHDRMHGDKMMMDGDRMGHMMDHGYAKLLLSRASVPATLPLHEGYFDGESVYFVITDSSDPTHAEIISESQGWTVELAPPLANAPDAALSQTYMFTNGMEGDGVHGFQGEVFTSTPAMPDMYSALTMHTHVTWNADTTPRVLMSEAEIMDAEEAGEVTLTELDVVINMPHVMWPGGQLMVNEAEINDKLPYGGGQVTEIDTDAMTVTFVAHRGWGPDGRTIYYIVTDATPAGPAEGMGVPHTPTSASLIANSAAVDLFQFTNGLKGPGPLGFQPGIATAGPGDAGYSPMWRIHVVTWEDEHDARLLENIGDIQAMRTEGKVSSELARPMDSEHIVNCPFIDPFQ